MMLLMTMMFDGVIAYDDDDYDDNDEITSTLTEKKERQEYTTRIPSQPI